MALINPHINFNGNAEEAFTFFFVIAGVRRVWYVLDNYFKFTKDKAEWKDNKIVFDITEKDNKT